MGDSCCVVAVVVADERVVSGTDLEIEALPQLLMRND